MGLSTSEQLLRIIAPGYEARRRRARRAALVREERRRSQMRSANDAPSIVTTNPEPKPQVSGPAAPFVPSPLPATPDFYAATVAVGKLRWATEWNQSVFGFFIARDTTAPGGYIALPPGPRPTHGPKVIERYAPLQGGGWRIDPLQNR